MRFESAQSDRGAGVWPTPARGTSLVEAAPAAHRNREWLVQAFAKAAIARRPASRSEQRGRLDLVITESPLGKVID